jgi:glycosyltransferase involved in cell wall biosynthesis
LRKGREKALGQEQNKLAALLKNDDAKREIASIYRSDLTLVISEFEASLLRETFKIDPSLLFYLPFLIDTQASADTSVLPNFKDRKHFINMGNFKHRPNRDAVLFLKQEIWPLIRKALPDAEMHIYGAYVTEELLQLNNVKEKFLVKGWAADKKEVYMYSRVCLAPLRFGAGLKGKLIDAMQFGTPCITTRTGAEGMQGDLPWNGFVEDDVKRIAEKAVLLYQDEATWNRSRNNGFALLKHNFDRQSFEKDLKDRIDHLTLNLAKHRENNFIGSLLSHHTLQSTRYLSKWIEAKNTNAQ